MADFLERLVTFSVTCVSIYYLFARAEATQFLWSRYRGLLDRLARCPACSGFWIGAAIAGVTPAFLPVLTGGRLTDLLVGGVWGLYVTPIAFWPLHVALRATQLESAYAVEIVEEDAPPEEQRSSQLQ